MLTRELIESLFLGLMFLNAGIGKIKNVNPLAKGLSSKINLNLLPLIFFKIVIVLVIILEIVAPLGLLIGTMFKDLHYLKTYSAIALIIFTILASVLYHPITDSNQIGQFLANLAVIGGLLAIIN
jgi:putative oxidoreductase